MFLPSHIGIAFDYHGGREIWYNADMRKVAMLKVLRKAIMVIAASIVPAMASSEVMVQQNITLKRGWNAVYIEVAPTVSPDEAFADWPVKSAGFYDPASFLATRQFSQTWESQGLSMKPVATWYRGVPEASQMKYVPAGTVCIAFNTNDEQTVVSVMGVPAAPRMTWHVTDTNEVYNFVGFSLQKGASVSPRDYLDGFDGNFTKSGFYKFSGNDEDASPSITRVYDTAKVSDGDVLLVASDTQSDWSGVLNVSPMGGLDFGSDSSKATLGIRNDGAGKDPNDDSLDCTRLVGRSAWNTKWLLIIPAGSLGADREAALSAFVNGVDSNRDGKLDFAGVTDIKIGLKTYSTSGN